MQGKGPIGDSLSNCRGPYPLGPPKQIIERAMVGPIAIVGGPPPTNYPQP